jgi:hypothetical protein
MRNRLETITNIATLATCVLIAVFLLQSRGARTQNERPMMPTVGQRVGSLPDVKFQAARKTLLIAIREGCRYCEESTSFYKSLVAQVAAAGQDVQLVVVTPDNAIATSAYLRAKDIVIPTVVTVTPAQMQALKLPGTPALILTNQQGSVEAVWLGKLNESQEREVFKKLS